MHWCLRTDLTPKAAIKPLWFAALTISDFLKVSPQLENRETVGRMAYPA